MSSKVLIIAGMHRSGTSLIAHYLNECGLNVGDNLINQGEPKTQTARAGHHEDKDFIDFHERVFQKIRMDAFPEKIAQLPIKVDAVDNNYAKELLAARADLPQWGWKDPRTTLFLDFWNDLIPEVKYFLIFRHPLAVVDSLVRRGKNKKISRNPIIGLRAWNVYNRELIRFWQGHQNQVFVCEIDTLIQEAEPTIAYLENTFELKLNSIPIEKIFSRQAFNPDYPDQIQAIGSRFKSEVSDAMELYQTLQNMQTLKT